MRAPAGLLAFLVTCVVTPALSIDVARADERTVTVKVRTPTRVYYEPVSTARVVDEVTLGAPVTIVEDRGDWVRVKTSTGEGWIQRTYVDLPGSGVVTTTRLVKVTSPASLYFEPLTSARIVENLATGNVTMLEDRGDWIRVRTASGDGWVQKSYLDLSAAGTTTITRHVTLRSPTTLMVEPTTTARVMENLALGVPLTLVEDRGDWVRVETTSGSGWVQRTYVDLDASNGVTRYVTLTSPATLMLEPTATSRAVETVALGAPVTLLEDRGDWVRVQTMSGNGWVRKTYVSGSDGMTPMRIVTVKTPTTLLLEPTAYSRAVRELGSGAPLTLVEDRGDWIRVKADTGEGWIQRTYVDVPGPGGVVTTRVITVREPTTMLIEPSSTARVLESLRTGAPITLVEDKGEWIRVRTSSGEGWIQRTYAAIP